jgi:hypothetical protein
MIIISGSETFKEISAVVIIPVKVNKNTINPTFP